MRGEVLHYDQNHGFGFITGEDGNRYTFRREDLSASFPLSKGVAVEFRENGGEAREVSLPATSPRQPSHAETPSARAASLTATTIAGPAVRREPQRYGRNAVGDGGMAGAETSTGLWSYFWTGVTGNYANFSGRARRKEYWGFLLFYWLGIVLLTLVGLTVDASTGNLDWGVYFPLRATVTIVLPVLLAGLVPGIAMTVRRLHDIGLSGWFYLLMLAVGVILTGSIFIMAIVLGLIPSQRRDNKWGAGA